MSTNKYFFQENILSSYRDNIKGILLNSSLFLAIFGYELSRLINQNHGNHAITLLSGILLTPILFLLFYYGIYNIFIRILFFKRIIYKRDVNDDCFKLLINSKEIIAKEASSILYKKSLGTIEIEYKLYKHANNEYFFPLTMRRND